jgi:hypothetical protein
MTPLNDNISTLAWDHALIWRTGVNSIMLVIAYMRPPGPRVVGTLNHEQRGGERQRPAPQGPQVNSDARSSSSRRYAQLQKVRIHSSNWERIPSAAKHFDVEVSESDWRERTATPLSTKTKPGANGNVLRSAKHAAG